MLEAQEGVAPHRVCQEAAAAVAVAGPDCLLLALPCTASPILDGCTNNKTHCAWCHCCWVHASMISPKNVIKSNS